ncbi:MAG: low molecular weight phosphotyrosine protein phosphatase [Bacteroidetes bacterium]|nr:MAG: low molecular weight phosphotyrosine protein phosphatase [Bacteroidota bacterium]
MKILMVCLGNICRSPLAEGILKHKIKERGLDWTVDSAGTGSWHVGERPDPRSIAMARKKGIDISDQRARKFTAADFDRYDLILAMDSSNYRDILRRAKTEEHRNKVALIMNFASPGRNENVPDPYWDDNGFEQVFDMLEAACDSLIQKFEEVA